MAEMESNGGAVDGAADTLEEAPEEDRLTAKPARRRRRRKSPEERPVESSLPGEPSGSDQWPVNLRVTVRWRSKSQKFYIGERAQCIQNLTPASQLLVSRLRRTWPGSRYLMRYSVTYSWLSASRALTISTDADKWAVSGIRRSFKTHLGLSKKKVIWKSTRNRKIMKEKIKKNWGDDLFPTDEEIYRGDLYWWKS